MIYCQLCNNKKSKQKTCAKDECHKRPYYNKRGMKGGVYCVGHKEEGMIDVKHKTCAKDECDKQPHYNKRGMKTGLYCVGHREEGMIDVVHKTCAKDKCDKLPHYNKRGMKGGLYCAGHKEEGMINVVDKTCAKDKCDKRPHYNKRGMKVGVYCVGHKDEGMVNVVDKTCIGQEGTCVTRSNSIYRMYCLFCFMHAFPDEPITRNYKTKEFAVVERVQSRFPDFTWRHDKRVQCGISKRRPDLFLDMGSHVLIVEIDEDSHKSYDDSCENKRLMQLSEDVDHRPLVMIRFNPDSYMDITGNKRLSCWVRNGNGITVLCKTRLSDWNIRIAKLLHTIEFWAANVPEKMLKVVELFMSDH